MFEKAQYILNNYFMSKKMSIKKIHEIKMFLAFEKNNLIPNNKIDFFNVDADGYVKVLKG